MSKIVGESIRVQRWMRRRGNAYRALFNREFTSKLCKHTHKTLRDSAVNFIEKLAIDFSWHFTEKVMANQQRKRCSILLGIREMQIKSTMPRFHTPIDKRQAMLGIKEETEFSYTAGGYVNWHTWYLPKLKNMQPS